MGLQRGMDIWTNVWSLSNSFLVSATSTKGGKQFQRGMIKRERNTLGISVHL